MFGSDGRNWVGSLRSVIISGGSSFFIATICNAISTSKRHSVTVLSEFNRLFLASKKYHFLLPVCLGIERGLSEEDGMFLRGDAKLVVERVVLEDA